MSMKTCVYNPLRDVAPVSPDGAIDLQKSYVDGVVPATVDSSVMHSNGIEDPGSIMDVHPSDNFDLMRIHESIHAYSEKNDG